MFMNKNLNQAVVGDRIIQFGEVVFDGPGAVVIAVEMGMGKPCLIKVRVADGRHTAYPCAGFLGSKKIVVA